MLLINQLINHLINQSHVEKSIAWSINSCHLYSCDVILILCLIHWHMTLTHWGWVTHICIGNLTIIGSDDSLSPCHRQAITWTNIGILLIEPLGTNFLEILFKIHTFSFKKKHLNRLSAKIATILSRPQCANILRPGQMQTLMTNDIFKYINFKENHDIFIKISLKFVPKHPIDNISPLTSVKFWN